MKTTRVEGRENRIWIAILAVLGVVIVGLIVGIVVVSLSRSQNSNIVADEEEITERDMSQEIAEENIMLETYQDVMAKVALTIHDDPVDFETINGLIDGGIEKALSMGELIYVLTYINDRTELFVGTGHSREALDALIMSVDAIGELGEPEQYKVYRRAFELAEGLSDNDALAMFSSLMDETEEMYLMNAEVVEESINGGKGVEQNGAEK